MPTSHEFQVEGHHLVALGLNPETAGEPIVLLHGLTTSIRIWCLPEFDFLREHGPCYAVSLPGHYPATFPPNFEARELTADMIARVLTTAIEQLLGNHSPFTLIGISAGGFAALDIAAHSPDGVSRLVCISGPVQGKTTGAVGLARWLAHQGGVGRALCKGMLKAYRSPRRYPNFWRACCASPRVFDAYPGRKAILELTYADFMQMDLDSLIDWHRADADISSLLPGITAPTLVLAGDRDPIVPSEQARVIAEKVPKAELVMFAGAGHLLFLERPTESRRAVDEWLHKTG